MASTSSNKESEQRGPTALLSSWVSSTTLNDIPDQVLIRAKHLILDGLACGLVGAHLPWSEKAALALFDLEPAGW
jgi:aconitate decarboxylase